MTSTLDFDKISVSTKTFIITTNITLDIEKLFDFLTITPFVIIPKRRGRKKKVVIEDPNKDIPNGSIITLEYEDKIRGVDLKNKKNKLQRKRRGHITYFRNSITIVMLIEGKRINFKISRNGKFQMTGCKSDSQAEQCVHYIWTAIKDSKGIYQFVNESDKHLEVMFVPAMRNIDFDLGFSIDREKLDEYFNTQTEYFSLLETNIGYTGVNIKIPITKPITELQLKQRTWKDGIWGPITRVPYQVYLDMITPKEREKKLKKKRFNTFLVFHSGKTILSSICADYARDTFNEFMTIMRRHKDIFEEKLDET